MKVPPPPEAEALRAAAQAAKTDHAALARQVRRDLPDWVRAMVLDACAELESATQRNAVVGDRTHTVGAIALLRGRRESVVERIVKAMEQQLDGGAAPRAETRPAAAAGPGKLSLTLIDESQIDEDIEIARIVQAVEAEADAEIRQLAALSSGLRGLPGIETTAMPLRPLDCATALRTALLDLSPDDPTRLFLLRHLGSAMGRELRQVYVRLSDTLLRWGVRPAKYRVKQTPQPAGPARAAAAAAAANLPAMATLAAPQPAFDRRAAAAPGGALQQLVERARRSLAAPEARIDPFAAAAAPPPEGEAEALALRLFTDPLPTEQTRPALDPVVAVQLMERLFAQIEQHLSHVPATRSLLAGLQEPGRALAAREAQLWNNAEHPWWKFLDRLIAMGSVHDESEAGDGDGEGDSRGGIVTQSLALVVERMRGAQTLDRDACQTAADAVEALASRHLGETGEALASQSGALQQLADREQIEIDLRNQLVQQLRSTPVCSGLRRFLVGPWTQAMASAAVRHGLGSKAMDLLALVVDDLIRATAKPGQRVSRAQRNVLLRQVGEGLAEAEMPTLRIETEVAELQALLRNPPEHELAEEAAPEERWDAPAPPRDTEHTTAALDLHAGLPTVPIGFGVDSTLEAEGHKPWLESLQPGDYCRLFLMGRWINAQLSWVSGTHNLFLFSSRHGGRTHSLTKRMLGKLRVAGLATRIESGTLLAQAMQTLVETDFAGA